MKKVLLATTLVMFAGSAFAGGLSDPIVAPEVIMEDTAGSASHDWLVPVMVLISLIPLLAQPAAPSVTPVFAAN